MTWDSRVTDSGQPLELLRDTKIRVQFQRENARVYRENHKGGTCRTSVLIRAPRRLLQLAQ